MGTNHEWHASSWDRSTLLLSLILTSEAEVATAQQKKVDAHHDDTYIGRERDSLIIGSFEFQIMQRFLVSFFSFVVSKA